MKTKLETVTKWTDKKGATYVVIKGDVYILVDDVKKMLDELRETLNK